MAFFACVVAFTKSCITSFSGRRRPPLFLQVVARFELPVLYLELPNARLLGGERLADAWAHDYLSIELSEPAAHRTIDQAHVFADLRNAQTLLPNHLYYLQLKGCIKRSALIAETGSFIPLMGNKALLYMRMQGGLNDRIERFADLRSIPE